MFYRIKENSEIAYRNFFAVDSPQLTQMEGVKQGGHMNHRLLEMRDRDGPGYRREPWTGLQSRQEQNVSNLPCAESN